MTLNELIAEYSAREVSALVRSALVARVVAFALEWSKSSGEMVRTRCVQQECVEFVRERMESVVRSVV